MWAGMGGHFVVYLTQSYLTRWFCRLEASVAMRLQKPLVIIYEVPNPRPFP